MSQAAALSHEYGDWELAGRLLLKVAEIYLATAGEAGTAPQDAALADTAQHLLCEASHAAPPEDQWRIGRQLIPLLAGELNRLDGREALRLGDWRVVIYCVGGARTLRQAIARGADALAAIDGRCGRMALRIRHEMAELALDSLRAHKSVAGCAIDLEGLANFHGMFGWLIGTRLPIGQIALDYDAATFQALALPRLPEALLLDGGWTGFSFPAAFLDYPVIRSTDELIDWPRHSFLFNPTAGERAADIAAHVRNLAMASLRESNRLPSFEAIAAQLAASAPTIRRRLADAGTSFRQIKHSCRRELALELLRRSELSIEEISERLDFCDSDAFRAAFKIWVGVSPSAFRNGAGAYSGSMIKQEEAVLF